MRLYLESSDYWRGKDGTMVHEVIQEFSLVNLWAMRQVADSDYNLATDF